MARSENIITGPGGEVIARPEEVPTGLVSSVKALVRAAEEYVHQLEAMVDECRNDGIRPTADRAEDDATRAERLGFLLAWQRFLNQG